MAVINSYSGYLIEASQLANLANTVNQIESFAAKELDARNFATQLRADTAAAKASGGSGGAAQAFLARFMEMLQLTKVSSSDISSVQAAVNVLNKYRDDANYPSAMKNARQVIVGLADTLAQVTPEMMYSAMVN